MNVINETTFISRIDQQRVAQGFLTVAEMLELTETGNVILDFFSVLISKEAVIGSDNVFYPNVVIEVRNGGSITINNSNTFYPNCLLLADKGRIAIGNYNQFGDGGVSVKANQDQALITFGDKGRYLNGVQFVGRCNLGSGSQVIGGPITVQNCTLESGENYVHKDSDLRGGVIKGFGLARDLQIMQGRVINGQGNFDSANIQDQSFYHPKSK